MTGGIRIVAFTAALSAVWLGVASADTSTITSGTVSQYWDGSLSGFQLSGSGTQLNGEVLQSPPAFLPAGTNEDLSGTVQTTQISHPFSETVNGTSYPSVWVKGDFTFTTKPFGVPNAADGTVSTFSTPFTMKGRFAGYADQAMTTQVFSVSLDAIGVVTSGPMRFSSSDNAWAFAGRGSVSYTCFGPLPSSWTATDIGDVGQAGVASYVDSVFRVAGAGADIWGSADAFQFVSQPLSGNGEIIAHVDTERNTSPYSKAGIMIRQTLDPESAHVILDVKPDGGIEFMTRSATGGRTTFLGGAVVSSQPWLSLRRAGSTVTASVSTDGSSWTVIGSTPLRGGACVGLAVTSHDTTALNQAVFDDVSVTADRGASLPPPWSQTDVGAVGQAGSASGSNDTVAVSGAGADIWGMGDAFHYAYQPMNGDGEIDVRVTKIQNTNVYAKAGVMIRQSLDPSAAHVILDVKPDGGIEFMARLSDGMATTFIGGGFVVAFPVSLKVTRVTGSVESLFTASVYDSATARWKQVGSTAIHITTRALVGLAVTSHDAGTMNTSVFDHLQMVRNLIDEGGFEAYAPPALGTPGWVSDNPLRRIPAKSETNQPHNGAKNGACWATTDEDCGMYQEVTSPAKGNYILTLYANADRPGGLVGVNVNGATVASASVGVHGFGNYGAASSMAFSANAGDTIRVWVYSPSTPGYVVIDDVTLVQSSGLP